MQGVYMRQAWMSILNKTPAPENPAQVGMCLLEEKREKSFIKHMHPKMKTRKLLVKEIEQEQSEEDEDRYKPQPYPLRTSVFRQVQSRLFEQMTGCQFIFNFSLTFTGKAFHFEPIMWIHRNIFFLIVWCIYKTLSQITF